MRRQCKTRGSRPGLKRLCGGPVWRSNICFRITGFILSLLTVEETSPWRIWYWPSAVHTVHCWQALPEDYAKHAELDAGGRPLLDRAGNRVTYGELLAKAPPSLQDEICLEVLEAKHQRCNAAIDRIAAALKDADLDVLIVIGDDQHEQYFDDNMPSILVYWGETIANRELQLPEDAPDFWRRARSQFHEADGVQEYPVSSTLGLHLIEHLIATDFDVSHGTSLPKARGEGHAFGFVHKRLMRTRIVPIVPIALNTYFPPNQPRPARCYQLGQQIRAAVAAWPGDKRGRYHCLWWPDAFHHRRGI